MGYYAGNGVYNFLRVSENRKNFFGTSRNLWLLVYGDENYEPKVLTVASGNRLDIRITEDESRAVRVAKQVVENTDVPINFVRFAPDKPVEQVRYWAQGMNRAPIISSEELRDKFLQCGLRMNEMHAQKSINDASSSPYHDWQRVHMGNSIVVADIDLLRFKHHVLTEMIELKRSCIDIGQWEPYREDDKNFVLISKLARKRKLDFYIVYNHRTKKPFFDDVSKLKIFEFDHRRQTHSRLLGYKTIQQFTEAETKKGNWQWKR